MPCREVWCGAAAGEGERVRYMRESYRGLKRVISTNTQYAVSKYMLYNMPLYEQADT